MNLQISLEDTFYRMALNGKKNAVLLCDRGCMDGSAYLTCVFGRCLACVCANSNSCALESFALQLLCLC